MSTMNTKEESANADMPTTGGTDAPFANFGWNDGDSDVSFDAPAPTAPAKTKDQKTIEEIKGVDDIDFSDKGKAKSTKTVKEEEEEEASNDEELNSVFSEWDAEEANPADKPKPAKAAKPKSEVGDAPEEEGEDGGEEEGSDESGKPGDDFYKTLTSELKEKGIFSNVEVEDDEEVDEDRFFELQEEEVEARAEDLVKGLIVELKEDPTVAAMIKYVRNGGKATNFLASMSQLPTNTFPADYDIADKKNATKLLEFAYKTFEEMDAEEIKDKLEWLEEKGKTLDTAEKYHKRIVKADDQKTKAMLDAQVAARDKNKKDNENLRNSLTEALKEDKIGDFPFSAKEKKELPDLITKATVKVAEGRYITEFHAKMQDVLKTPKKLVILLKLLNNGFDTKDLLKEVNTTVTAKAKSRLAEAKKNEKSLSGNKGVKARSLAESFDE